MLTGATERRRRRRPVIVSGKSDTSGEHVTIGTIRQSFICL